MIGWAIFASLPCPHSRKWIAAGARLLVAAPSVVLLFWTSMEAFSPGVRTHLQAIVAEFISEGHFATHIRRMRKLYKERYDALVLALNTHLSPWLEVAP